MISIELDAMKDSGTIKTTRWTARIVGLVLILFSLFFFIGERLEARNPLHPYNVLVFTVLGIGLAGLILAWWKARLGGIISLISFIVFNILAACSPVEGSRYMLLLLFPLLPSLLHLLEWWLEKTERE